MGQVTLKTSYKSYRGKGSSSTFSFSKPSDVVFDTNHIVKDTDALTKLIDFDPAGTKDYSKANFITIVNEGEQTAEIQLTIQKFNISTDVGYTSTTTNENLVFLLTPGKFMSIPTGQLIIYTSDTADTDIWGASLTSASRKNQVSFTDSKTYTLDADGLIVPTGTQLTTGAVDDDPTTTTLPVDSGAVFKPYDIIGVDSELMQVMSISSNNLTVTRAVGGSTIASHTDDDAVYFCTKNHPESDAAIDSSGIAYTDKSGHYYSSTFFGYGRATAYPMGLVPGSIAVKFYSTASTYANLRNITPMTSTGLAANTAYAFNIVIDGATKTNVSFTTDSSNVKFGSLSKTSTGVLRKIQDALDASNYEATVKLKNGDMVFETKNRVNTSDISIANPSSGTTPWGVGVLPAATSWDSSSPDVPDDKDINNIMFDDGEGRLSRKAGGSGFINYETGAWMIKNAPARAEMQVALAHTSALSGVQRGDRNNHLYSISARSTNAYRNAYIRVLGYDDFIDDDLVEILDTGSSGGAFNRGVNKLTGQTSSSGYSGGSGL